MSISASGQASPPEEERWVCHSRAPEETAALGTALAVWVQAGDVIALFGDLGAGKTTLVQGLARGLGITQPVTSPTFILINEYRSTPPLYHVDCYRLTDAPVEAWEIGLEELLSNDGVCVIEWADRLASTPGKRGLLPAERLDVTLAWAGPSEREIEIVGRGARYAALVRALRQAKASTCA
ncbi:MAG: tRNA (adenosine(37)-N6)-threonylcarbamoyltransferase complex ATPase subunit type 1 TsaE [Anaerolineae bacterium]|nr:tRNA (adenosine(37)-N6)-threonylcarbamoyltransferase complex ATPase subunit type 1 TsaE [Anaerolineae bacterium]MDW8101021.1 tRNA (adenosine(37)-N6)-threonylcarbamoyltransferase complex ATPase subunit type 1 TsaE [Anaerolineae bacterium]